jgi:hypothetical protein
MAQLAVVLSGGLQTAQAKAVVAASGGGDKFANSGHEQLEVVVGATPTNLTVVSVACSHGRTKDAVFALSANTTYLLGPFPTALFNDANGNVNLSWSSVTTITVGVHRENS